MERLNSNPGINECDYENDTFFSNLYYGSIEKLVYLIPCPGKILKYRSDIFENIQKDSTIQSSLDNFHKLPELGDDYKNIHCIGIPANDILFIGSENEWISSNDFNKIFFDQICNSNELELTVVNNDDKVADIYEISKNPNYFCLIKISKEVIEKENLTEKEYLVGFQSGKRSCIVKLANKYYRLKGCGNFCEGFPMQYMNFPKGSFEVRGCQFKYSAIREAYMTDAIANILKEKFNLKTTNIPVNIWEFGEIESNQLNLKNDLKKIKKYCGVYEVIGEKRLGCHLFPGIELILAKLIDNYIKEKFVTEKIINEILNNEDHINIENSIINKNIMEFIENLKNLEKNINILFEEKRVENAFINKKKKIDLNQSNKNYQVIESYLRNLYKPEKEINATFNLIELIELDRENGENLSDLFTKYEIYKDITSGNNFKKIEDLLKNNKDNLIFEIFSPKNILERSTLKCNGNAKDHINKAEEEKTLKCNYFNLDFLLDDLPFDYMKTDHLKKHDNFNNHFEFSELKESVCFRINKIFEFLKFSKMNFLEFIALIYERLGYEAGRFKRILQEENINWGTYEDLPFRFHSNAHTDNFSVIPRKIAVENANKNKNINLLSILDFDLAFFRENFFNILSEDKNRFGKPDNNLYDFFINSERQVLEWEVAGMENFVSFENLKNKFENDEIFNMLYKPIIYLLRDSAVLGYRKGYLLKKFDNDGYFEKNIDVVYDLIELGLLCSNHILG